MRTYGLILASTALAVFAFGCAATGGRHADQQTSGGAPAAAQGADASIHINGLACPYCVYNVERSVKQVAGVKRVAIDLNTGVASIWFESDQHPEPKALWAAVKDSGFTPAEMHIGEQTYAFD